MKKVIQLLISAFLILSISACSETTSENPTASSTPVSYTHLFVLRKQCAKVQEDCFLHPRLFRHYNKKAGTA